MQIKGKETKNGHAVGITDLGSRHGGYNTVFYSGSSLYGFILISCAMVNPPYEFFFSRFIYLFIHSEREGER